MLKVGNLLQNMIMTIPGSAKRLEKKYSVKKKIVKTVTLPEIPRPSSRPVRPIRTSEAMDMTRSIWAITRTSTGG